MRKRQSPASRDGMLETVFFVYSFQEEWLQCHRIDQERSIRDDKKKLEQAKKRLSDLDVIISRLYEDYVLGNLSQDRYKKMAADYEAEQERLKLEIEVIEEFKAGFYSEPRIGSLSAVSGFTGERTGVRI